MNMVVDYENNVLVMQYDTELDGDEGVYCYVYDYEPGMFGTHEDAEGVVNGDETRLTDPNEDKRLTFNTTQEHIPLEKLSPRAQEMCRGSEILRMRKIDNNQAIKEDVSERKKRGLLRVCRWRLTCYRTCFVYCWRVCRLYRHCYYIWG